MSLFKRKTRATRRAEARAIKAKAKLEAKLAAKNEARRIKSQHRSETRALKAQIRAQRDSDRAALKVAETQAKDILVGQIAEIDTRNGTIPGRVSRIDPAAQNGTVTVDVSLEGALPSGARPDLRRCPPPQVGSQDTWPARRADDGS